MILRYTVDIRTITEKFLSQIILLSISRLREDLIIIN